MDNNSLFNLIIGSDLEGLVQAEIQEEVFNPTTHPDDRDCRNCTFYNECTHAINALRLPDRFENRSGWSNERLQNHFNGIFGQICNSFNSRTPRSNRRHARTLQNTDNSEWDREENK